eukprot:gene17013-23298_t
MTKNYMSSYEKIKRQRQQMNSTSPNKKSRQKGPQPLTLKQKTYALSTDVLSYDESLKEYTCPQIDQIFDKVTRFTNKWHTDPDRPVGGGLRFLLENTRDSEANQPFLETHGEAMREWKAISAGVLYSTAIEKLYDIVGWDDDEAKAIMKEMQEDINNATSTDNDGQGPSNEVAPVNNMTAKKRNGIKSYRVYTITCTQNNRIYVGITSQAPAIRFAQHRRNPPHRMKQDATSYTPFDEHFIQKIVAVFLCKARAVHKERTLIDDLQTTGPKGYNVCSGNPYS